MLVHLDVIQVKVIGQGSQSQDEKCSFFGYGTTLGSDIFTARSELHKVLFLALSVTFLFVYEILREPLNGFAPNSHGRRVWSLARTSLKVKINFGGLRAVYIWKNIFALIMTALRSRCGHYIFALWFLSIFYLSFFIPRLISAVGDWISAILRHMVWPQCEFRMQF